ncbi:class II aldolase/adducin family protein [Pseudoteredinibacter isoporae]|uniref:Ribulose-5-phosphate 4-epimerase/fuculose-1-phosphate aldolase n=1 Tax=Pseudoteredinibacter isoporae TaxID=570281 RepID=A0A7X0MWA0_9GAMM|nr:class II aldolase/adducin family protein [Pseudoteredinibacter isoporae]MBB6522511.1 ribulose-5-phosphate 4-epimerase/fuculose-1-phosphate aldolase [Pseudoteredinibacter isoporae]NHO88040.1 class II aldolase/adducin family protein [Pseudoteredinibacter isoporae]NIB23629.1 class II aldolase/adducin family protein [Pseudoteredinibacter isoporae]
MPNVKENDPSRAFSSDEWKARVDLAALYRLAALQDWTDLIFTHISLRVPGENAFLLNPMGFLFEEITPENLVKVDINGNKLQDTEFNINPAGFTIHSAVHKARADAHCVFHLHTDDGIAVASHKDGLLPLNQTALTVLSEISYHEYEGIALDLAERERLVEDLGNKRLMILRNHGTMAVGENCGSAFIAMYMLESACTLQQKTCASSQQPLTINDEIVELVAQQVSQQNLFGETGSQLIWPAMLRKVKRHFADWCWSS